MWSGSRGRRLRNSGRKRRRRASKLGFARGQKKNRMILGSHPNIALVILADHHQGIFRQPALSPKHSSAITIHAAEFVPASVPQDVAIHQHTIHRWPGSSQSPGKPALGKSIMSGFGMQFDQTRVGAEEGVPLAI